jgi:hypothetical protein
MIVAALIAAALLLFADTERLAKARAWLIAHAAGVNPKHVAAVALLAIAAASYAWQPASSPDVTPTPAPPGGFTLRGAFTGPDAADDAAMLSALLAELADCIERDGTLTEPRLRTGVAFDDLRIAAREARMRGESLGAKQPKVRDAIHRFLDQAVGTSGGPVTPDSRSAWVAAFRDLSRACMEAVQ